MALPQIPAGPLGVVATTGFQSTGRSSREIHNDRIVRFENFGVEFRTTGRDKSWVLIEAPNFQTFAECKERRGLPKHGSNIEADPEIWKQRPNSEPRARFRNKSQTLNQVPSHEVFAKFGSRLNLEIFALIESVNL
jgi:hypothetical protein